jgi:hypothetical protein
MTAVFYDGCEWPIDETCLPDEWDDVDQAIKDRSVTLASNTLRRLTGYRVGGCPITVRPCRDSCAGYLPYGSPYPYGSWGGWYPTVASSGNWINCGCGCAGDCSCTTLCQVALPAPVGEVYEVKVDGATIAETDYRMYGNLLTWTGTGDCPWPTCQDLTLDDDQPGTFSVNYLNSYPVDGVGAYAAATLAWEYAQACSGGACRLPLGVTAVTRQGLTYEVQAGAFPGGFTGIREVDAYIALWNPKAVQREAFVWTPDMPRVHH